MSKRGGVMFPSRGEMTGDMPVPMPIMSRVWAMPDKWTFTIPPIKGLLDKYMGMGENRRNRDWVDPFAGLHSPANITNDIESSRKALFCLDGLEFLQSLFSGDFYGVLFDPPYSAEQCLRRYTPKFRGTAGREEYRAKCKDEIARVVVGGGIVISLGWDSNGMGKARGFELVEVMLVCHGACHNDTIVTVERRIS